MTIETRHGAKLMSVPCHARACERRIKTASRLLDRRLYWL